MNKVSGRVYVMSHYECDDGTHECLLTYQDAALDDERELWHGIGMDLRTATEACWRAFWKWRDKTEP